MVMDLTVFANGANRNVSGVTEATTCSQIVYVLAHATNQKGRFVLVARFNGTEYRLSQNEKPLDIIKKCKMEGCPVSFELRQLPAGAGPPTAPKPMVNIQFPQSPPTAPKPSPVQVISSYDEEKVIPRSAFRPVPVTSMASTSCSALPPNPIPKPAISHNISFPLLRKPQPRPPPPSYEEVIGQKYNSLSRESSKSLINALTAPPNSSTASPSQESSYSTVSESELMKLSRHELEQLIEKNNAIINSQKMEMLRLENSITDRDELELFQLHKQHNNLRMVLDKLNEENWPQKYEQAKLEYEELKIKEQRVLSEAEAKRHEIDEVVKLQHSLEAQLAVLEREVEEEELLQNLDPYPEEEFDLNLQRRSPTKPRIAIKNALDYKLT